MRAKDAINKSALNWANFVTSIRVLAMIPLGLVFQWEQDLHQAGLTSARATYWLLVIAAIIVLSDFVDGIIARRFNQITRFGKYFDPLCDKLVILGGAGLLVVYRELSIWMLLFLAFREALGVYFGTFLYFKRGVQGETNFWGKVGVALVAFMSLWFIIQPLLPAGIWQQPELAYYPVVFVYIGGIVAYWHKYRDLVFHHDENKTN